MTAWDKLPAHSRAINRNAANAIKGGCGHDVTMKPAEHHQAWDTPPKMCAPPADAPNYVGRVLDRLTVIGWLAEPSQRKNSARWVVRCSCGQYEARKSRAFNQAVERQAMCRRCERLEYVKGAGSSSAGATRRRIKGDEA
jgi:hypothetical protein